MGVVILAPFFRCKINRLFEEDGASSRMDRHHEFRSGWDIEIIKGVSRTTSWEKSGHSTQKDLKGQVRGGRPSWKGRGRLQTTYHPVVCIVSIVYCIVTMMTMLLLLHGGTPHGERKTEKTAITN